MSGFAAFFGKELTEIVRTWRLYVLPGIMLFFGLASPIIAEVTPGLIASAARAEGTGIVIEVPPATTVDAYVQWGANAGEVALLALIIIAAGAIAGERTGGTAQMVLAKPVSRTAMLVAKLLSTWLLLGVSTIVSVVACIGVTAVVFDTSHVPRFLAVAALWYLLACMLAAATVTLSVLFRSQTGAAAAGVAVYIMMPIVSLWEPARDHSPAGLIGLGHRLLAGTEDALVFWPVVTGLAAIAGLTAFACWAFGRQDL
ncbi:MAG TPA: ABC transporter permease [Coriobacteriia bacterium]|nr:ABC transporter permease [Coriobacteriia bacterium]